MIGNNQQYMYAWEYVVSPERVAAFERTYGSTGEWVELFRRAPGYLRSELYRDRGNPQRFMTIDYWESRAAWEAFRRRFAVEFEALDARCAELTAQEREIGRFEAVL
jgi:quinol monooxygenase YgiN